MTGQIADTVMYEGEDYSLIGLSGTGLFEPEMFGIEPWGSCTACWRGYIMVYECTENELLLKNMMVSTRNDPPSIHGKKAGPSKDFLQYMYEDLNLKTEFTGTILIGRDFINEMYVHMGFQRPICYKKVFELTIENGDILEVKDLSKKMSNQRRHDQTKGAGPRSHDDGDVKEWIADTFSLDYEPEEPKKPTRPPGFPPDNEPKEEL